MFISFFSQNKNKIISYLSLIIIYSLFLTIHLYTLKFSNSSNILKTNFYNFKNRSYNNYFCNNLVLFFPSITKRSNDGREKKIQSIRSAQADGFLSSLSLSFLPRSFFFFFVFFLPYQASLFLPKHNFLYFFRFLNYHHISMPIIVSWLSNHQLFL